MSLEMTSATQLEFSLIYRKKDSEWPLSYELNMPTKLFPNLDIFHLNNVCLKIAYADDLVLFANSDVQLSEKVGVLCRSVGLQSTQRSLRHVIRFSPKKHRTTKSKCTVDGVKIRQMGILDNYVYLSVRLDARSNFVPPDLETFVILLKRVEGSYLTPQEEIETWWFTRRCMTFISVMPHKI